MRPKVADASSSGLRAPNTAPIMALKGPKPITFSAVPGRKRWVDM